MIVYDYTRALLFATRRLFVQLFCQLLSKFSPTFLPRTTTPCYNYHHGCLHSNTPYSSPVSSNHVSSSTVSPSTVSSKPRFPAYSCSRIILFQIVPRSKSKFPFRAVHSLPPTSRSSSSPIMSLVSSLMSLVRSISSSSCSWLYIEIGSRICQTQGH